jgi:hypothetical protein
VSTVSTQETTVIAFPISGDYRIDVLLESANLRWNAPGPLKSPVNLSYSFAETLNYLNDEYANGFLPFTDEQRKATREVLSLISSQFKISFTEVIETQAADTAFGQLRFANNTQTGSAGYAAYPPENGVGDNFNGDNFINNHPDYLTDYSVLTTQGAFNWSLLIHELLHSLGIKHPGNYNGGEPPSKEPGNFLVKTEDNPNNSVMTYVENPQGLQRIDLGLYDMLAVGYLYGEKPYRVESNQYVFSNSTANQQAASTASDLKNTVVLVPDTGRFLQLINDTGGDNSFNFKSMMAEVNVNLGQGKSSSAGFLSDGETLAIDNIQIAFGTEINTLVGSNYNDKIVGNLSANWLEGGSGNDTIEGLDGEDTLIGGAGNDDITGGAGNDSIDGGEGTNTAVFNGLSTDYTFNYDSLTQSYSVVAKSGAEGKDTLKAIEIVKFSDKTIPIKSIDATPPTITITSSLSTIGIGKTATITFVISESVTDFSLSDIKVSGGTLTNFSGSGTTYTALFTPAANSNVNGVISVASVAFTDAAGNVNVDGSDANNKVTMTVDTLLPDTTPPTIAITTSATSLSASQTSTITFTLSESSTNFTNGDVVVAGGTLSNFNGSGTSYTALFTPTANSTANGTVSVASGVFSDAAGNTNADGLDTNNIITLAVDTVVPTIAVSSNKSSLQGGNTATLTFTLSEASTNFEISDITVEGGTLSNFTGSGTSYSATFTLVSNSAVNGAVNIANGVFTDVAGNKNADGSDANNAVSFARIPTITNETHTLSVIVDKNVLGPDAVLLKGLKESMTISNGAITKHIVEYAGSTFEYNQIDSLITTVTRDSEFTAEFTKEINDYLNYELNIPFAVALKLVGAASIDGVILSVAGSDGNFVV